MAWSAPAFGTAALLLLSEVLWLAGQETVGDGSPPSPSRLSVVWAVNCGGDAHVDSHGVHYASDPLRMGTASDYGKQLVIARASQQDQPLYQTERYHTNTFGYDVPVEGDGWYVLALKFSEVYFAAPNMKVFDVVLNGDLTLAADLDIFEKVGRGVAHDEVVEFQVKGGKILWDGDESELTRGKMRVEFIKSYRDNPKVNAIVLARGRLKDWPQLPAMPSELDDDDLAYGEAGGDGIDGHLDAEGRLLQQHSSKNRNPSGPRTQDPYEMEDSTAMLPIFVAIGAFIPLVFCLCKL